MGVDSAGGTASHAVVGVGIVVGGRQALRARINIRAMNTFGVRMVCPVLLDAEFDPYFGMRDQPFQRRTHFSSQTMTV